MHLLKRLVTLKYIEAYASKRIIEIEPTPIRPVFRVIFGIFGIFMVFTSIGGALFYSVVNGGGRFWSLASRIACLVRISCVFENHYFYGIAMTLGPKDFQSYLHSSAGALANRGFECFSYLWGGFN